MSNAISRCASCNSSTFATPILERLVYGLVYPALLGASLVEIAIQIRAKGLYDFFSSFLPWFLVIIVFVLDYVFTASETSEEPPIGNVFLVISDLVGALSFGYAYCVLAIMWNGTTALSPDEIGHLVYSIFGLHISYGLWYAFRIPTRDLALKPGSTKKDKYKKYLDRNLVVIIIQAIVVVLFGVLYLCSVVEHWALYVIVGAIILGLALRAHFDCKYGPWKE